MKKIGVDGVITHLEQWQLKQDVRNCYGGLVDWQFGCEINDKREVFQEGTRYSDKSFFYDDWLARKHKHCSQDIIDWFC